MNNDTFVEPPCVLLLSIWFRVWNPGFVKYLKMRSSEVHNITLFLIRKNHGILGLLVMDFTRTHSELPNQPIVQWSASLPNGFDILR